FANRGSEQFVQPVDRFFLALGGAAHRPQPRPPVVIDMDPAAFGGEDTPGFELGDAFPARCGSRQIFKKQKPVGWIPVWRGLRKSGMALQRRHLRREDNTRAGGTVIERLFAKAIAHQKKAAGGSLAIGKGEHSVGALDRAPHALATNEMKKGFRIGM